LIGTQERGEEKIENAAGISLATFAYILGDGGQPQIFLDWRLIP
jgi:hypothetical protein